MKKLIILMLALTLVWNSVTAQASNRLADKIVEKAKEQQNEYTSAPEVSAQSWVCENCGNHNDGNFCWNCGAARPSVIWTCPVCFRNNEGNFCSNCGTPRPSSSQTESPAPTSAPESGSDGPVMNLRIYHYMIPDVFVENLNYNIGVVASNLFENFSEEDIASIQQYLSVTYTEVEGDAVYYDNIDWNVEVTCFSYDGLPAKDRPADEVGVNYPTDLDAGLITLLQCAMALSSKDVDPSASANEIIKWMGGERKTGDEFQLLGCYLAVMTDNGRCQFSLIKNKL